MAFTTNANIVNGEYGRQFYDQNKGKLVFEPLGKAVTIERIVEDIETGTVTLHLSFDYVGEKKTFELPRRAITDHAMLQELANAGADITKKNFNIFVDSLRLQELDMEANGMGTEKVYTNLGWKTIPVRSPTGNMMKHICYRANEMIGPFCAQYVGNVKIAPMGTMEAWTDMVNTEILGNIPAEVVMLASMSAMVNGLISHQTTGENSIIHLCGHSGTGKTTIAEAGASVYGEPFNGERTIYDQDGTPIRQTSVFGNWAATENATIGRCAGNRGYLVVLNELGKFKGSDMTSLVYNLSEGTDKVRMNQKLQTHQSEGFSTTILSVGELSLLGRCKDKTDGLRVRVLELDMPMTTSTENADKIKQTARKNNGWAAPLMAEYIIKNGGIKMVLEIYERKRHDLLEIWPDTPAKERFVSKFPALLLATAELAQAALGIAFHVPEITDFFLAYEQAHSGERNTAMDSYDFIIEQCRININKFYIGNDRSYPARGQYSEMADIPRGECWGRITNMLKPYSENRVIVQELEVRKSVVDDILRKNGFPNRKTCISAWKDADLLDYQDEQHPCRKRKVDRQAPDGTTEAVFVFRVFCDPDKAAEYLEDIRKRKAEAEKRKITLQSKTTAMQSRVALLEDTDEDEDIGQKRPTPKVKSKLVTASAQMQALLAEEEDDDE